MAMTPDPEWLEFFRTCGQNSRVLCRIYPLNFVELYQFLDRPVSTMAVPVSLSNFTVADREVDWKNHRMVAKQLTLTFIRDPVVESMITTYPMVGAAVEMLLGGDGLALIHWLPLFSGIAAEPRVYGDRIELPVNAADKILDEKIAGGWIGENPVLVIADAIDRTIGAAHPWRDRAAGGSFTLAGQDALAHYCVSRGSVEDAPRSAPAYSEPTPVVDVVQDLLTLMNASLVTQEDGLIYLKRFDTTASVVANWTLDDIEEPEVVSLYENLTNSVVCRSHWQEAAQLDADHVGGPTAKWNCGVTYDDTDSQARFATMDPLGVGNNPRVAARTLETLWVNGHGRLAVAMASGSSPGVGGTFVVQRSNPGSLAAEWGMSGQGQIEAMCGASWGSDWYAGGAQEAARQLDDDHTAYLKIYNEIVEVDRLTISAKSAQNYAGLTFWNDPGDAAPEGAFGFALSMTYRVLQRGALGTTAAAHGSNTDVSDVTMQYRWGQTLLAMLANGGPVIKVRTSLRWHWVQLMDVVTVTWPSFIAYGMNGLDTDTKFVAIGKQVEVHGENPGITWTLLYLIETVPPASTLEAFIRPSVPSPSRFQQFLEQSSTAAEEFANRHTASGFAIAGVGGFDAIVPAGVASSGTVRRENLQTRTITCRATRDTYVYWDLISNSLVTYDVAVGAGAPTADRGWVPLAMLRTDGAGIIANTDLRSTSAMSGSKLTDLTITESKIGPLSVTEGKIGALAVTGAKIGVGAVTEAKIGTGEVTETKLASDSVTKTKIKDGEVNAGHSRLEISYRPANVNFGSYRT